MLPEKLPLSFYLHNDVISLSQQLLGCYLVTKTPEGELTSGIIVETEAYQAPEDKASHAYNNRRTARTETMFLQGGVAYVYLCYGIHHLFNVVTGPQDLPHAILIRAIEPKEGIELMLQRRLLKNPDFKLSSGPGMLSQALGISTANDGVLLSGSDIWIEPRALPLANDSISASPRIGVGYAKEYAERPWRFYIKNNPWVSRLK